MNENMLLDYCKTNTDPGKQQIHISLSTFDKEYVLCFYLLHFDTLVLVRLTDI